MSEQTGQGRNVNPNQDGGSTSDENWHGDAGDQANDLRFAEEQQLINDQASVTDEDVEPVPGGGYTGAQTALGDEGGFTGAQNPAEEGEYTDVEEDPADGPGPQGDYTDVDSVPSIQESGDADAGRK